MTYLGVRRRLIALALTLGVPAGMLWAPFLHVHPDDDHHVSSVHAHLGGHAHHHDTQDDRDGPALHERESEHPIYLDALVAVDATPVAIVGALTPVVEPGAPPEREAHVAVEVTHGHDPPLADPLETRPPPARLS